MVNFLKIGCQRKEFKIVTWNCNLHSYNRNRIETVMQIMYCRKYHLHSVQQTPTFIMTIKIVTHIFTAETATCIGAAKTSNCIGATEAVTCMIGTDIKCQLLSSNRNCHLQNWLQKHSLAEMVPVRDSFSYNLEIEHFGKHQV